MSSPCEASGLVALGVADKSRAILDAAVHQHDAGDHRRGPLALVRWSSTCAGAKPLSLASKEANYSGPRSVEQEQYKCATAESWLSVDQGLPLQRSHRAH